MLFQAVELNILNQELENHYNMYKRDINDN
jgi:hypothetical protein